MKKIILFLLFTTFSYSQNKSLTIKQIDSICLKSKKNIEQKFEIERSVSVSRKKTLKVKTDALLKIYKNSYIDTIKAVSYTHLDVYKRQGPLQLADFIGLDVCLSILNVMYDGFKNPKYAPCPLLVNMVMAGKLGVKSGEGFYDYSESKKAEKVSKQFK